MSRTEHFAEGTQPTLSTKQLMRAKSHDFGYTMATVHRNAPEHALQKLDELGEDLKQHGIREPVEVFDHPHHGLFVCDGHHRVLAAHRAGIERVPVRYVPPRQV